MWSDENEVKSNDNTNFLTTTLQDVGDLKTFTTRRPLNTGNALDFIIEPDTFIPMNFGYNIGTTDYNTAPKETLNESVRFVPRDESSAAGPDSDDLCLIYDNFSKFDGTCCY